MDVHEIPYAQRIQDVFKRYRAIIEDWDAFVDALMHPMPIHFWTNTTRLSREMLSEILQGLGYTPQCSTWNTYAATLPSDLALGGTWPYLAGLLHIQEEVSMLPVHCLQPKPGERFLDLCAAPGNKTARLSVALNNRGTIVANDRNPGRLRTLRRHISQLGLYNIAVTHFNAARYPSEAGMFDGVLVDAPCTGMGTSRKTRGINPQWAYDTSSETLSVTQEQILNRAFALCKPGGSIVYSTCTYAPQENERVIHRFLQKHRSLGAAIEALPLHELPHSPGLTAWGGEQYAPELAQTARFWPHQLNSGGFFVAKIRKSKQMDIPSTQTLESSSLRTLSPQKECTLNTPEQETLAPLFERFGLPQEQLHTSHWTRQGRRNLYFHTKDLEPPEAPIPDNKGLLVCTEGPKYTKLTTIGAMVWSPHATRHTIELTKTQKEAYLQRQTCIVSPQQSTLCEEPGIVIVRYKKWGIGTGLWKKDNTLESLYPKSKGREFMHIHAKSSPSDTEEPSIRCRRAQPADLHAIYLMGQDVWGAEQSKEEYLRECEQSSKYKKGTWYVLEQEGVLVSSLIVYRGLFNIPSGCVGIGSVATDPKYRKQGHAAHLIRTVCADAQKDEVRAIYLFSDIDKRYYERLGFQSLFQENSSYCMLLQLETHIELSNATPHPF